MSPSCTPSLRRAGALLLGLTALQATVQAQVSRPPAPQLEALRRSGGGGGNPGAKGGAPPSAVTEFAASSQDEVLFVDSKGAAVLGVGLNYKAMFSREGMVFVPFFGSDAPRSYPLHLQLERADVGCHNLPLAASLVTRTGNQVALHHGPMTELYELELDSMEQLFHIKSLPAEGDLVLQLSVSTELMADEGEDR